jgi:hypothetical protein
VKVVQVFVENIWPEAEQGGLTRFQFQTDIESHLKEAGITAAPFSMAGYLHVKVKTAKGGSGAHVVSDSVHLTGWSSSLARLGSLGWPSVERGYIGVVAEDRLREVGS